MLDITHLCTTIYQSTGGVHTQSDRHGHTQEVKRFESQRPESYGCIFELHGYQLLVVCIFLQFQKKYRIRNVEPTPLIQQVGRESDKFCCRWGSCYGYAPIIGPVHVLPSCHKLRGIAVVFSLQLYSWFQGAWLPRFSVGTKCANRKFECICASNSSIDRNQARANELEWLPHTTHRLCTRICIYIYIHTYIHIHIHIYERLWKP